MKSELLFESTMKALERGLTVDLIATTPVFDCNASDSAQAILEQMADQDFSQALVKDGDASVGIIQSPSMRTGMTVADVMEPLRDWMLVSRSANLRKVVRGLARPDRRFRLVVGDSSIEGIVTRSDVHKLPVRMLAFTMVTHLESILAATIRDAYPDSNDWLQVLATDELPADFHEEARKALNGSYGEKAVERLRCDARKLQADDPDLLDMTGFPAKWFLVYVARSMPLFYVSDMALIQRMVRNKVAHSAEYAPSDDALDNFEQRLTAIEYWIKDLSGGAPDGQRA
jgi:predicted transcriptional regulator